MSDVTTAAQLIAMGLEPKRRPSSDLDYAAHCTRYRDDPLFAKMVREVAEGLGLKVLDVSEYGIVLGITAESPFQFTTGQYRRDMSADERLVQGLVHVALAAWLYPRAEDLEADGEIRQVCVVELDTWIREQTAALRSTVADTADAPTEHPELERAFEIYQRLPATREGADGRRQGKTTQHAITQACARLEEHGLFRKVSDVGGGTYQALHRYRVQVREHAAHEGLRLLRGES